MLRRLALATTLSLIATAWCASTWALNPDLDVSQYAHTAWKVRDGFSKGEIESIAQTPDGYLWLGTEFGLLRFDGVRAIPWHPPGNQHMPPGPVYSLLVSRDGALWIGTTKGLARWKDGKLNEYLELSGEVASNIVEDPEDGTVWVGGRGTPPGKLCAIHDATVHCVGADGRFGRGVFSLFEDSRGNLWAGTQAGLWRWKPGPPRFYDMPDVNGLPAVAEDTDGAILVGWNNGIYRFTDGKFQPYRLHGDFNHMQPHKEFRDREGGLWIGTSDRGLLHLHQGKTDVFSAADGLSGDTVYAIFEDREGDIWVCTTEGLDRFREFPVATVTTKQGLSINLVTSLLADKDGSVWLGTYGGLNRLDHGKIATPATGSPKRDGMLNGLAPESLLQDRRGRIWISTLREIGYLENGRFSPLKSVPGGVVLSMAEDNASELWVINENAGLFRISPQNDVRKIPWARLGHEDYASVLTADRRESGLWIGFSLGGIAYFSNGQVRKSYTVADGLGAGRVSDFLFDDENTLWISTQAGLSRLKNNHLATLSNKNGLPCDTVHGAMEGDDRSMWLYTACGLLRIARSELDSWAAAIDKQQNGSRTVRVTVFDSFDGVKSLESPNFYHPEVAKTPDGKLWFLPWDGVSVIDPHHLPFNSLPPPVHIERIVADRREYDTTNGLRLPPHVRDLSIDYTALSVVVPEKVHFRFKLEGQDPDWREVVNDRQVQYSNLKPRHYTFRVIACNNSGVWNETGASLEFSIAPAYYQTTWFAILCAIAFSILLWALFQLRLHQLRRQYAVGLEERVGERIRIARELHDTLLQGFQGLMGQIQAAIHMLPRKPEKAKEALEEAILSTEQAIAEGRDAIRDLRPEPVTQRDLPELLNAAGKELAIVQEGNGHSPAFRVTVEGEPRTLSVMLQDEVYRIAREVIRNSFRHAVASRIEVEVHYDEDRLRLRIRDDGRGIDSSVLEPSGGRSGHWGIPGIRERAQRIGSRLEFWSEVGIGTEVELTLPAAIAYGKQRNGRRFELFRKAGADGKRS
jgi:signal transduction histidine kinase/ligand-binding sensor domain-containing protein